MAAFQYHSSSRASEALFASNVIRCRTIRHVALVVAGQCDVQQTVRLVFAEPVTEALNSREHAPYGCDRLGQLLSVRPGKDLFDQDLAQRLGAHPVQPIIGSDDARRERLQALAHAVGHVVVDANGKRLDQR